MANAEVSSRYLTKFAKLIRLILDNSRHSFVLFDEEVNALKFYLELEALRYEDKFKFTINIDNQLQVFRKEIPSMIIQPFIENAIWHGISLKDKEGLIIVDFALKGNYIICTVEDNGVGRKPDLKKSAPRNASSRSDARGIRITQDRVAVMVKEGYKQASIKITDLKDDIGNSLGTKVEITLPVKPAQKTYPRQANLSLSTVK